MTLKNKIAAWFSDRVDDIDFLRRKDVSTRFKILNLLSGDRLRSFMCFTAMGISDAIKVFDDLQEYKALCDGELKSDDYEYIIYRVMWYIKRAQKDVTDIFEM